MEMKPTNPTLADAKSLNTKSSARITSPTAGHTRLCSLDATGVTVPVVRVVVCSALPAGSPRLAVRSCSLTSWIDHVWVSGVNPLDARPCAGVPVNRSRRRVECALSLARCLYASRQTGSRIRLQSATARSAAHRCHSAGRTGQSYGARLALRGVVNRGRVIGARGWRSLP